MKTKYSLVRVRASRRRFIPSILAAAVAMALAVKPSNAALAYWDSNGTTAGAGATPTGTWGTSTFWNTTSTGLTTAPGAWVSGSVAVFSAGTDAVNAYTVTMSGAQTIGGLTVEEGTPTISGAGSLDLNNAATPFAITGNTTISSVISGTGFGITKTGAGILTLSGTNTYTGAVIVNAGTLAITQNAALGTTAGATTINGSNGTTGTPLSLSSAATGLTIADNINLFGSASGRATLINDSAQSHTLSGAFDVSSATNVAQINSSNSTGSITINGDITGTLSGGAVLFVRGTSTNANNRILGSVNLTGGKLSKTDGGVWLVGATGKTYSWVDTQIANGTIKMGVAGVLSATTGALVMGEDAARSPTLDLNGFNQTVTGITYAAGASSTGTRTITSVTAATLTVDNATDFTATGSGANSVVLTGALGLTKLGAGALSLNGTNSFTGAVIITQGQLNAASTTGFGSITATTNLTLGGASTQGILNYTGAASSSTRPIVIGGAGGGVINSTTGLLTLTGTVNLNNGPLTIGGANSVTIGSATATNRVSGSGVHALTKTGAGTLTLSTLGANAAISGAMPINVNGGTLSVVTTAVQTTNLLGTGGISITPGANLSFSVGAITDTLTNTIGIPNATGISTITNSGAIVLSGPITFAAGANSPTLRFTNTNGSLFGMTASGGISGPGNISLNGTGNAAPITISTGTVNITGSITNIGTNGAANSVATISAPITTTNLTAISQQGASPFTISSSVGLTSALNTFTSTGAGLWTFSNANTFTGSQPLTFNANSTGGITVTGTNLNHTGSVTNSGTNSGTTTISSAIGANVTDVIQNSATSPLVLSGTNSSYTGTYTVTNGVMQFGSTAAMTGFTGTPNANVKIAVGSGGILSLAYPAFTAGNLIDLLANAGVAYPNVSLAATGTSIGLDTTAGSTTLGLVLENPLGVTLGLTKRGTNTLTLGNANTFSGPVWIQNGTLSAGSLNSVTTPSPVSASSLGVPLTVPNGTISLGFGTTAGVLSYTGAGESTDRVINLAGTTGGGGIDNAGAGTLTFSSPMTFSGTGAKTLTISGASNTALGAVAGGGVGSTSPLTIAKTGAGTLLLAAPGSTVNTNSVTQLTINGGIVDIGTSGLTISNSGLTVIQTTANATINATGGGVLTISSSTLANAGDIRPAGGTTLTINANIATPVTNTGFWTAQGGGLELNDAGTLVLNGSNTIAGVTSITAAGTISVGNIAQNLGGTTGLLFTTAGSRFLYTGNGETTALQLQPAVNCAVEQAGLSGTLNFSANWATGAAAKTVTLQGSTAGLGVISGIISNNSGTNTTAITKAGTGTWTLSANNTYTGATTVNAGNLRLTNGGTTNNSAVTVNNGGTLSIVGNYTVGNTATAAAGGRLTLAAGGTLDLADGAINDLTLTQNATFASAGAAFNGGTIKLDVSGTDADSIINSGGTVGSTSSASNAIVINPIAGFGPGTYTIINGGAGSGAVSASNFYLATNTVSFGGSPFTLSLSVVGKNVLLTITAGAGAAPGLAYWNGTNNSSWADQPGGAATATNWVAAASGGPDTFSLPGDGATGTNVFISSNIVGGSLSTTLDAAFDINSLNFTGTGTSNTAGATIAAGAGGTLTLNAAAVNGNAAGNGITVLSGSGANTISAPVILGASQTWTNNSNNPLTLTNTISGTGLTLTTAGTGSIQIGNGGTTGSIASDVLLINNGNLIFNRSNTLTVPNSISGTGSLTKLGADALVMTGTNSYNGQTIINDGTLALSSNTTTTTGQYRIANTTNSTGILTISAGSSLTNSVGAGSAMRIGVGANAVGVVTQNGGTVSLGTVAQNYNLALGGDGGTTNSANTNYNFGAYNLNGGTAASFQTEVGDSGGTGMMTITDGTFGNATGARHFILGRFGNSVGVVTLMGTGGATPTLLGAASTLGIGMGWSDNSSNNRQELNIGNLGFVNASAALASNGLVWRAGTGTGNIGIANLLTGGTLQTGYIGAVAGAPTSIFNFNGGTVVATQSSTTFATTLTSAYIYPGGAIIDTNTFNDTVQALLAPTGNGVTLSGGTGSGYLSAPYVKITGDGVGATAIATIDGSGNITGFTVTNPGVGYTNATVTLVGGGGTGTAPTAGLVANTSGGLTKIGTGTLTLTGAGTYTGKTTVSGGGISFNSIGNVGIANSALGAPTTIPNGTIDLDGTLTYTGTVAAATDRVINLTNAAAGSTIGNSGSALLTLNGDITGNATNLLFRGNNNITMNGLIGATYTGPVSHTDGGTLTLTNASNAWTGNLVVSNGIVSANTIADKTVASAIGAGTLITFGQDGFNNTGRFQFTGVSGGSSDRDITILSNTGNTNGGIIENTVAGQLLTLSGAITTGGSGLAPSLQLTGAGNGLLSGGIAGSPALSITKSGTGFWILSGNNTYTGATTLSAGTLQFSGSNALNSATPISMAAGTFLQIRDDAASITHTSNNITASSAGTVEIYAANNGGATTGSTVAFGTLSSGTGNNAVTYNFTGANGYLHSYSSVALPGTTGATTTFNPTTSSVTVTGNVTNQMVGFANTNFDTLVLSGTSDGNAINGVISDAATASPTANGLTRITKQGTSTWTLGGVSTYRGPTTVNGGSLKLASGSGLANTAITVNSATGPNPTFSVTPGSGTINIGNTGVSGSGPDDFRDHR